MIKPAYLYIAIVVLVLCGGFYISMLQQDVETAQNRADTAENTIKALEVEKVKMQQTVDKAQKDKAIAEGAKQDAKVQIKTIIRDAECSDVRIPRDAVIQLQQFRATHTNTMPDR